MQTSSCTVFATPVGAATTPEFFLDTALLNLDPCRFGAGLFLLPFFITAGDSVLNSVIIKTAPIFGAKGDENHAEYSSITPPNSPRVARITSRRDFGTATKQNRTQALVCKNQERSITLEKIHSCRHRRRNPYGQKTSRDEVLRRNLIAAGTLHPRWLTEGR